MDTGAAIIGGRRSGWRSRRSCSVPDTWKWTTRVAACRGQTSKAVVTMFLEYAGLLEAIGTGRAWTVGVGEQKIRNTRDGNDSARIREAQRTPMSGQTVQRRDAAWAPSRSFAGNDGPEPGLHEPDEQEVGSVTTRHFGRELDLAIAITCAQRGAAPADIHATRSSLERSRNNRIAFGFEGEGQQCRVCGCGDAALVLPAVLLGRTRPLFAVRASGTRRGSRRCRRGTGVYLDAERRRNIRRPLHPRRGARR